MNSPPPLSAMATIPRATDEQNARPYSPTRYEAFRVTDIGFKQPEWRTLALALPTLPDTVAEALNAGMVCCFHKDMLVIKEADELSGDATLYLYAIKRKSRPDYFYRDFVTHREHRLYADPICSIDGNLLFGLDAMLPDETRGRRE